MYVCVYVRKIESVYGGREGVNEGWLAPAAIPRLARGVCNPARSLVDIPKNRSFSLVTQSPAHLLSCLVATAARRGLSLWRGSTLLCRCSHKQPSYPPVSMHHVWDAVRVLPGVKPVVCLVLVNVNICV